MILQNLQIEKAVYASVTIWAIHTDSPNGIHKRISTNTHHPRISLPCQRSWRWQDVLLASFVLNQNVKDLLCFSRGEDNSYLTLTLCDRTSFWAVSGTVQLSLWPLSICPHQDSNLQAFLPWIFIWFGKHSCHIFAWQHTPSHSKFNEDLTEMIHTVHG